MDCAYCRGNHKHKDCTRATSRKERLELLRKFKRCFNCINKGHLARECRNKGHLARGCRARRNCNACGGSHHVSICEKGLGEQKERKGQNKKGMRKS